MHGPTFMGNALACSVALKSIEIFERDDYISKIKNIEKIAHEQLDDFYDDRIKEIRIMGACTVIELKDKKDIIGYQEFAYERGVFSRPFIKYIYSMVPYVINEDDLRKIFITMKEWFKKR